MAGALDHAFGMAAALSWGPKTRRQLTEEVGCSLPTIDKLLAKMKEHGLVYRHSVIKDESTDLEGNKRSGHGHIRFALNHIPFEHEDQVSTHGVPIE